MRGVSVAIMMTICVAGWGHPQDEKKTPSPKGKRPETSENLSACRPYQPGRAGISFESIYGGGTSGAGLIRTGGGADSDPTAVNTALERELTPALLDVFSSAETRVYFGDYDPADGTEPTSDGLRGLRVIYERAYRVGERTRLVTVITSWQWDRERNDVVFIPGPDSVRVRAQIDDAGLPGGHFASLSYSTSTTDHRVSDIRPGAYVRRQRDTEYWVEDTHLGKRAALQARASQCNTCHGRDVRRNGFHSRPTTLAAMSADLQSPFSRFRADIPEASRARWDEKVADLRMSFTPPGIVAALRARCDGLSARPSPR